MGRSTLLRGLVAIALVCSPTVATLEAQTNTTVTVHDYTGSPFTYTPFTVTSGGVFTFFSTSSSTDPYLYLFEGSSTTGAGMGALVNHNDDGNGTCGSSNVLDSCFQSALGLGDYTLASGIFYSSELDARNNTYDNGGQGNFDHSYTSSITSPEGRINLATTTTPEPASLVLLATGLVGVVGAARRKRSTE